MVSSRLKITETLFISCTLVLFASVSAHYAKTDDNCTIEMKEVCDSEDRQRVCKDETVKECHMQTMTVYHNDVKRECSYVPEKVCEENKHKHCEVVQKPVRKVILVRECKEVMRTVCNVTTSDGETLTESKLNSYENTGDHSHDNNHDHNHDKNHEHCDVVLKETCRPVPEEKCEDVNKNVTRTEIKQSCEMVTVKECEVQYKHSCDNQTDQEVSAAVHSIGYHYYSSGLSHRSKVSQISLKCRLPNLSANWLL